MQFGQLFQKYDSEGYGRLGRADFERMMRGMLEESRRAEIIDDRGDITRGRDDGPSCGSGLVVRMALPKRYTGTQGQLDAISLLI